MAEKMKNHYKAYTTEDLKTAVKLHESGLTQKQIAEQMGRTLIGIKDLCKRLGLKRYKLGDA